MRGGAPSVGRWLFCSKARASALLHFLGQLAHGGLRDAAAFAARNGCFGFIDGGKDFGAGAFALRPQAKGFLYRIFFAVQASAFDGMADKCFLIGGETYFHVLQR